MAEVWEIMSDYLYFIHHGFGVRIYSFVLMQNHFHAIMQFPKGNMSSAMNYFMRECSRNFAQSAGRINQIWGSPYFKSELNSYLYFLTAYKYLYRNPVAVGLVKNVEEYEFSTLSGLLGFRKIHIPMEEDTVLFDDIEETIRWLNEGYSEEQQNAIRNGLKKGKFSIVNPDKRRGLEIKNIIGNFKVEGELVNRANFAPFPERERRTF